MHIAPANGFVPQTYTPLLTPFMDDFHIISLPYRAMWGDETPPQPAARDLAWSDLANDLLAGMAAHDVQDVIAVGHSIGGITSILSVIRDPSRFRALILLDPTILPVGFFDPIRRAVAEGKPYDNPLSAGARRRRNHFNSHQAAFDYFRDKPLFADWSDDVLWLYVRHGFTETGDGVRLVWAREWEAYYFTTGYAPIRDHLPQLNDTLPVLVISGGDSDTFPPKRADEIAKLMPDATFKLVPGYGHMFPQAAPDAAAAIMRDWLNTQNLL